MSFQRISSVDDDTDMRSSLSVPEIQNFHQFTTIDWVEEDKPFKSSNTFGQNVYYSSSYHKYKDIVWQKGKTFITLTCIAATIGCIAGFLQIFTETLVNWKSGYCSTNWLLNKSFCCASSNNGTTKFLTKRSELKCISEEIWVNWPNPFLAFVIFLVLSVSFAMCSALMIKYIAPMATGSGISEIKVWVSGFQYKDEFLNLTTLIVKSVALPLAISSGLSVGKEGPSVHYATCCGYVITNFLLSNNLRFPEQSEYLIASTAGGVAVAFGAPIGGVLFALEEISTCTEFKLSTLWKSYYIALGAVATLQYINPFRNGKIVVFEVTYDKDWHVEEIPVFVILGIFGGLYGNFISKWNVHFVSFRRKYLSAWPLYEVFFLALITALISYFNEFLKLDMTESMEVLFHECVQEDGGSAWAHRICKLDENTHTATFLQVLLSLCFATVVRALLVVVSYGCRVPAGIFVPSMAVGATFGRAVSLVVERFITGPGTITPGTYAFLGAAAALSGITNLTLTVVVIMFELTGAFMYIIPTMIVVAITRMVFSSFGAEGGIADQMIIFNGFPLFEDTKEDQQFLNEYTARDIMSTDLVTIKETTYLSEMNSILQYGNNSFDGFPVVRDEDHKETEKRCVGYVLKNRVNTHLLTFTDPDTSVDVLLDFRANAQRNDDNVIDLGSMVNHNPIFVKPDVPLSLLFHMFEKLGCKTIIVEDSGILVGLITKKDLLKFQRIKHRDLIGPLYTFNENWDERVWSIIQTCINKFRTT